MRSLTRAWLLSVGFLVLGMGLMWWASAQWAAWRLISASEFVMPLPSSVTRFLFSEMALVSSALLLGFLVSGMVDSRTVTVPD